MCERVGASFKNSPDYFSECLKSGEKAKREQLKVFFGILFFWRRYTLGNGTKFTQLLDKLYFGFGTETKNKNIAQNCTAKHTI